jgi:hypothetical protein
VFSCYTNFVLKNVTVTVPEDLALWARRKAAEENCSVSKLLCRLMEEARSRQELSREMLEAWRKREILGLDGTQRLSRDEAHERR